MPKITKISPQRKKGRYNIFIDGRFALGVDEDTLIAKGLKRGMEMTLFEFRQLEKESDTGKLFEKTLRFLEIRPRSEFEVGQYIKKKVWQSKTFGYLRDSKESQRVIEAVVEKLKKLSYLNDNEFAKWWVGQRRGSQNPRGSKLIKVELIKKGVPREIIQKTLLTADKLLSTEVPSEEELALKAAQKKLGVYKNLVPMELKRKMSAYLARRGFGWPAIQKVLDKIVDRTAKVS